jgi:hypothetical protein
VVRSWQLSHRVYIPVLVPVGDVVLFCRRLVCDCLLIFSAYWYCVRYEMGLKKDMSTNHTLQYSTHKGATFQ